MRWVNHTHTLTELRQTTEFVDLAADAGILVLCEEILKRFAEAEVWQRDVEHPFESIADAFCAKTWQP